MMLKLRKYSVEVILEKSAFFIKGYSWIVSYVSNIEDMEAFLSDKLSVSVVWHDM